MTVFATAKQLLALYPRRDATRLPSETEEQSIARITENDAQYVQRLAREQKCVVLPKGADSQAYRAALAKAETLNVPLITALDAPAATPDPEAILTITRAQAKSVRVYEHFKEQARRENKELVIVEDA